MTFGEVLVKSESLRNVRTGTWPRSMAYAISCNTKAFNNVFETYNEQRRDIASRYAVKDENGKVLFDEVGNLIFETDLDNKRFHEEFKELLAIETNVSAVKFHEKELLKCENDARYSILTPEQELALGWMIEYENHEND